MPALFNLGVEAGQLLFVFAVAGTFTLFRARFKTAQMNRRYRIQGLSAYAVGGLPPGDSLNVHFI